MRLLDTDTVELHEFHGDEIPQYAILSHTWGQNEVSFKDLQSHKKPLCRAKLLRHGVCEEVTIQELPSQSDSNGPGWQKIRGCCALAAHKGHKYVWIDTCCINKESSAELTEAINSMFRWYSFAEVCLAYLSDVPSAQDNHRATGSAFRRSKWFTRGWTLQEMLAPRVVEFFSADWELLGTKDVLGDVITERTGVPNPMRLWRFASVAAKMSWAAQRDCMRLEDNAYSLMGLFGINMPLLYGEGRRAFYRLQTEIIKQSADESIFAWIIDTPPADSDLVGLLAESPRNFAGSGHIKADEFDQNRSHYSITNKGLQIKTPLLDLHGVGRAKVIPLNCSSFKDRSDHSMLPVPFALVVGALDPLSNVFYRIRPQKDVLTLDAWRDIWSAYKRVSDTHSQEGKRSIYIMV